MRLLPGRADHERHGIAAAEQESVRQRHRCLHVGQPVPLRHLPANPQGHQVCGPGPQRECFMSAEMNEYYPRAILEQLERQSVAESKVVTGPLSRRSFMRVSAAV